MKKIERQTKDDLRADHTKKDGGQIERNEQWWELQRLLDPERAKRWAQMNDEDREWEVFIEEEEEKIAVAEAAAGWLEEQERLEQARPQLVMHSEKIVRQIQELEKQMAILMSLSDEALTLGDKKKADGYKARIHELDKERDKLKERIEVLTALISELPDYDFSTNLPPNTDQTPPSQFLH